MHCGNESAWGDHNRISGLFFIKSAETVFYTHTTHNVCRTLSCVRKTWNLWHTGGQSTNIRTVYSFHFTAGYGRIVPPHIIRALYIYYIKCTFSVLLEKLLWKFKTNAFYVMALGLCWWHKKGTGCSCEKKSKF